MRFEQESKTMVSRPSEDKKVKEKFVADFDEDEVPPLE